MTTPIGYDPQRIRSLTRCAVESIEALARVRSDDPAAGDAVRIARNARRNLEDVWMPLLREIEASDAMTSRLAAAAGLRAEWSSTARWLFGGPLRDLVDHELLAELGRLDETVPLVSDAESAAALDRWLGEQRPLAAELARRASADPVFAADLVDAAYASPLAGLLAGSGGFSGELRSDLLAATLAAPWWEAGWEMDKYAGAANTLLQTMLDDPARCLDVLGRDGAAAALAGWPPLDQDLVAGFVQSALLDAPLADGGHLPAGYAALREFVVLANEPPLDRLGFQPGVATGLARSIRFYVPTLIPGLENEHASVEVKSHGVEGEFDFTLGEREEVVDFFGAIVRTPAAQAELGDVVDSSIRDALGDRPQATIGSVAEFAELIELAARNEDEELAIAASIRGANLVQLGGVIGLALAVGTAVGGMSTARRSITSYTSASITNAVAGTVRADTVGGSHVRPIAYQAIQIEACRRFASDGAVRQAYGAERVGADPLRSIERRLADINRLTTDPAVDPAERQRAILNLVDAVRDAGGGPYLDAILDENSVDDLNEADHVADV